MPSGKTHTRINLLFWLIFLYIFLKFNYLLTPLFKTGIWYQYFTSWYLTGTWFTLFTLDYYIHTLYINPDLDTKSEARQKLGLAGWIIDKMFKHRKSLHKIWFWSIPFVPLIVFCGTFFSGGFLAVVIHIMSDQIGRAHV